MTISCIVVEDEPLAMERTRSYIERLPFLKLLSAFDNASAALAFIKKHKTDLIFLDINLGELSGIQLLENAKTESAVIFTTAYHEYALKGYELNVTDYLLKPYTFERFTKAVAKVQEKLQKTEKAGDKKFIFVKTEHRLEKILLSELLYIEGMRDYRRIHTGSKRIMTLQTFKDLEVEIPPNIICRVHKSYMVAIDKVESIERDKIKIGNLLIPISDTYKQHFYEQLKASGR